MASSGKASQQKDRAARADRERARLYEARTRLHDEKISRRRRDNIIAGVVGGLVIVGAIVAQSFYFSAGPGVPVPTPTPVVTPEVMPTVEPTTAVETPAPTTTPTTPATTNPSPAATN